MPIIFKLQDIDEAIENLRYKNETTLKSRLLRAVRQYYVDDDSAESLQAIDTEELVKTIWETGDNRELLKTKRKNFSSLKSSVNSDLKKLYADGKNPQGIVIGHDNIFSISDEAKDKALTGIMDVFREKGIDTQTKISEVLSALSDILTSSIASQDMGDTKEEIDRLKNVLSDISGRLGLSWEDIVGKAGAADVKAKSARAPEAGEAESSDLRSELSTIDKGMQELALEAARAAAGTGSAQVRESLLTAFSNMIQILKDSETDVSEKAKKLMAAVEGMLTEAIDASGGGLSGEQADQIKQIFHEMTAGVRTEEDKAGRVMETISSILGDAGISAGDKIAKIMTAVNDLIGEAMTGEGTGLSDEDKTRIRKIMSDISGNIQAYAGQSLADTGTGGMDESMREALADMVRAIQDPNASAEEKARKIIASVESLLSGALDAAGGEMPGIQAQELKQIIHEMAEGAGSYPSDEELPPTPARTAGAALSSEVSSILSDEQISTGDKISRIMAAVNDLIGEALAGEGTGLSEEDRMHIQEMMANITGNLETLVEEGLEIVEEEVEEGEEEIVEFVEEIAVPPDEVAVSPDEVAVPPDEVAVPPDEVIKEEELPEGEFEDVLDSAADTEELADELALSEAAGADLMEDIADAGEYEDVEVIEEVVLLPEEAAVPSEEVASAEEGTPEDEGQEVPAEETEEIAGELPEGEFEEVPAEEVLETINEALNAQEAAAETEWIEEILEAQALADDGSVSEETAETADAVLEEVDAMPDEGAEILEEAAGEIVEVLEEAPGEVEEAEVIEAAAPPEGVAAPPDEVILSPDEVVLSPDEVVEEITDQDLLEEVAVTPDEVIEEILEEPSGVQVTPDDETIDEDLREKTELLTRLAEAAGALTNIGPDLSGSIYTEEEIRDKAKFLSEEFDRYLSIRDRFYNAHILIAGGDYLVGGAHLAKSELEEQIVTLQDFYIGKFPITNALFEIFVEQTGYLTTAEKLGVSLVYYPRMQRSRDPITGVERFSLHNLAYSKKVQGACWHRPYGPGSSLYLKRTHPVVHVSLEDARAFAAWTGKRLPTEIEWEAAARTARGNIYPWGNDWREDACNVEDSLHGDTTPVDRYVKFANKAEVADTLGNVLEWTGDMVGDRETSDMCIAKGASWISHGEISLTDRHYIEKNISSNILGFRCVAI